MKREREQAIYSKTDSFMNTSGLMSEIWFFFSWKRRSNLLETYVGKMCYAKFNVDNLPKTKIVTVQIIMSLVK